MRENDPETFSSLKLDSHPIWSCAMHLEFLSSHEAMIEIYSSALGDGDINIEAWGPHVPAQKQDLWNNKPSRILNTKSDWVTTLIVDTVEMHEMSTDSGEYEMVPKADFDSDTSSDGNQTVVGSPWAVLEFFDQYTFKPIVHTSKIVPYIHVDNTTVVKWLKSIFIG